MRSRISPQIVSGVWHTRSSVRPTAPFGGVLDGDDRVVGLPALRRSEDLVDRRAGHGVDELSEVLRDRIVRKRARRAQVRDPQRLLEREARRHHLAEYADDRFAGERSAVRRVQARQHLRLALGPIGRAAGLERADRLRVRGARVEPLENLAVERIDRRAVAGESRVAVSWRSSPPSARRHFAGAHSSSSSGSTTRSRPASFSPSPRLISVTPCVDRPISRIDFTLRADQHAAGRDQHHLVVGADEPAPHHRAVARRLLDRDHPLRAAAVPRVLDDRRALAVAILGRRQHRLLLVLGDQHRDHALAAGRASSRARRGRCDPSDARRSRRSAPPCRRS